MNSLFNGFVRSDEEKMGGQQEERGSMVKCGEGEGLVKSQ